MKVICDNRYFLIGINKTIEDVIQKNKINGVKNIIIISSPKTSDVFFYSSITLILGVRIPFFMLPLKPLIFSGILSTPLFAI